MYTKENYSVFGMIMWTRIEIIKFIIISLIPIFLYTVLDWKWLHLPWLPIALVGTALAFIVSFKNNASYDRLWEARKIWGGIVNNSRSWAIMVKDFITNEFRENKVSDSELAALKKDLIYRHVGWMTALRHQMRKTKPWEVFIKNPVNRKYMERLHVNEYVYKMEDELLSHLSKEEVDKLMKKGNQASQLLAIQSDKLKSLKLNGFIDDFRHMEMQRVLVEFYTLQGKSERIKNFPYPRQFATLNLFFVWIFIFLLPFGVMNEFDKIGVQMLQDLANGEVLLNQTMELSYIFIAKNFVWLSLPFSVLISWIFYAMEKIGGASENPFEGTANDVPITAISNGIEIDIKQMFDDENLPEKIVPVHDILM